MLQVKELRFYLINYVLFHPLLSAINRNEPACSADRDPYASLGPLHTQGCAALLLNVNVFALMQSGVEPEWSQNGGPGAATSGNVQIK